MVATHNPHRDLPAPAANGSDAEGPVFVPAQAKIAAVCVTGSSAQWGAVGK